MKSKIRLRQENKKYRDEIRRLRAILSRIPCECIKAYSMKEGLIHQSRCGQRIATEALYESYDILKEYF